MTWSLRRTGLVLAAVVLVGSVAVQEAYGLKLKPRIRPVPGPVIGIDPGVPGTPEGPKDTFENSGISLPKDEKGLKKGIQAAQDYIKEEKWDIAISTLQKLVDMTEDVFIPVPTKGTDGKDTVKHVSAKSEAYRLIGSLPKAGMEYYRVTYGDRAQKMLDSAKTNGDVAMLGEVIRRFTYTDAGAEAIRLEALRSLNRGETARAALRYAKLLARDGVDKIAPELLGPMLLAFRAAKDKTNAKTVEDKIKSLDKDPVVAKATHTLAEINEYANNLTSGLGETTDCPNFRGNPARTNVQVGGPAFLEPRWTMPMTKEGLDFEKDKDHDLVRTYHRAAGHLKSRGQLVMPSFFPVTANVTTKTGATKSVIIYRNYWGIFAVDLKTAKTQWYSPSAWSLEKMLERGPDARKSQAINQWLQYYVDQQQRPQLVFENSVYGTLSTDNTYVYAVEDLAVPPPPQMPMYGWGGPGMPGPGAQYGEELGKALVHSKLHAYNLARGGALAWEIGGVGEKNELSDSFFLGPPLPLAGKLYVLTEKQQELRLACLDPAAGGRALSVQTLASTQEKIDNDVVRRTHAIHLAYGEGILVVPTNAGAVFGIDLLENRLVWAYPYRDKDDAGVATNPMFPGGILPGRVIFGPDGRPIMPAAPNTGGWKEAAPTIVDGKVVFTAPDARSIHCVNLLDGTPVWTSRRLPDDQFFAGVFKGKALIVGKKQVRALALADGKILWTTETGMPSGQGVAADNVYYLPLREGPTKAPGIAAIDMDTGSVAHASSRTKEVPGNLLFFEGDVVSQSSTQIVAYPQLRVKITQMQEILAKNPNDPKGLTELAAMELDQGDRLGAIEHLRKAMANKPDEVTEVRAREKLYDALTEYVQHKFSAAEEYLSDYEKLCEPDYTGVNDESEKAKRREVAKKRRAKFLFLVAKGREAQGKLVEAFDRYQEYAAAAPAEELIPGIDEPSVQSSADVWARGRIAAMVANATEENRKPLEAMIGQKWAKVQAKGDLEEVRHFVRMFGSYSVVGQEARFYLAEKLIEEGKPATLLEAERELNAFRGPRYSPQISARALESLARLYTRRGLLEDAAWCYRVLGRDYGATKVRDGRTGSDFYDEAATDKRLIPHLEEVKAVPVGRIKAREERGSYGMSNQTYHFAQVGDPLPFFQRYAVTLRFDNQHLQLLDRRAPASDPPAWSKPLTRTMLQVVMQDGRAQNATRFAFRNQGHLVVLPVGHLVYGIDPVAREVLWEKNLAGGAKFDPSQPLPQSLQMQQLVVDPKDGTIQVVYQDNFKQRLGEIGPMEGSVVCLQTRDGLEAIDPLKGTTLWRRNDLSQHTEIFGDDEYVYVVEMSSEGTPASGKVLRAADGATVPGAPNFATQYQKRVGHAGRTMLYADAAPATGGVTLRLYDVPTGKELWARNYPARTRVLHSEVAELAGVVDPDGQVEVFDRVSQKVVLKTDKGFDFLNKKTGIEPALLKDAQEVYLLADDKRVYLAVNGQVDPKVAPFGGVQTNLMPGLGMRALLINGENAKVFAYDRSTSEFKYYVQAPNQMIVMDHFQDIPVLLLTSRYNMVPGGGFGRVPVANVAAFRAVDKRNGKTLAPQDAPAGGMNVQHFHTLDVDEHGRKVEFISSDYKVTFSLDGETAARSDAAPRSIDVSVPTPVPTPIALPPAPPVGKLPLDR